MIESDTSGKAAVIFALADRVLRDRKTATWREQVQYGTLTHAVLTVVGKLLNEPHLTEATCQDGQTLVAAARCVVDGKAGVEVRICTVQESAKVTIDPCPMCGR